MLKYPPVKTLNCSKESLHKSKLQIPRHLLEKRWILPITNVCNKTCGGCNELCGHFTKEKLWYLPLEMIEKYIILVKNYKEELTIIGGEPTLHPQWEQILDLLYYHPEIQFRVNTNGRLGHIPFEIPDRGQKNVKYFVDTHPEDQTFFPGIIAAQDIFKIEDRKFYWDKAKKDCPIWATEGASIYQDKAYFCENAAAFDWMFHNGENGWVIEDGKNPFIRTEEEIAKQAEMFCYRCGWCAFNEIDREKQKVHGLTLASETNYKDFPKTRLIELTIVENIKKV